MIFWQTAVLSLSQKNPFLHYCIVLLFIKDSNFTWANAGATVFGSAVTPAPKNNGEEEGSDQEEAPNNVDIHFEPIVSLPEVPKNAELQYYSLFWDNKM